MDIEELLMKVEHYFHNNVKNNNKNTEFLTIARNLITCKIWLEFRKDELKNFPKGSKRFEFLTEYIDSVERWEIRCKNSLHER